MTLKNFWRELISYFVECPSVLVYLLVSHDCNLKNSCIFSKNNTEMILCPSQDIISRDSWQQHVREKLSVRITSSHWSHFISSLLLINPLSTSFSPHQPTETAVVKDAKNSLVIQFNGCFTAGPLLLDHIAASTSLRPLSFPQPQQCSHCLICC